MALSDPIGPHWLPAQAGATAPRFTLPLFLRLALRRRGAAHILAWEGDAPVRITIRGAAGDTLAETQIGAGAQAVYLPAGAHLIAVDRVGRLGLFPRSKLGLKLHGAVRGSFPGAGPLARWRQAAVAARDLRATHAALMAPSPALADERARAYRAYRAHYVEDLAGTPPADPALVLTFIGPLGPDEAGARARLAALAGQTDSAWRLIALATGRADIDGLAEGAGIPVVADMLAALDLAGDGLVCLLPETGLPTRDAVAMLREAFAGHPQAVAAYTDEERTDAAGVPVRGVFKPAFNRHLLRSGDYIGSLFAARLPALRAAGYAARLGEAARYDLLLRLLDPLPPGAILHVPRVAFSRAEAEAPPLDVAVPAGAAEVLAAATGQWVERTPEGRLRPHPMVPDPAPLVSFVIPTRDRADLLGTALRSLIALTAYRNFEIIIVDNGSREPETLAMFAEIKTAWPQTTIVRDDGGFNYPRICNAGVAAANGGLICLLNNDIEVIEPGWLTEMVALASEPRTGIVGAKLLFSNRTVQHAGVVVGLFRYAAHWYAHAAAEAPSPFGRLTSRSNVSAVTGACLMIRRDVWTQIGPLDAERFAEDCNDIDLCLRARRAGYEVVLTPFACLLHHESASRGRRRSKAHRERLKAQRARMEAQWHTAAMVDPHYNPNLSRQSLYSDLAPAPSGPRDARTDAIIVT